MDMERVEQARAFSEQTVFLVGGSFLLGSLCTIFLLLLLDWMKMRRYARESEGPGAESGEWDDAAR